MAYSAKVPEDSRRGGESGGKLDVTARANSALSAPKHAIVVPVVPIKAPGNGKVIAYAADGSIADAYTLGCTPTPQAKHRYDIAIPLESWRGENPVLLVFIHDEAPRSDPRYPHVFHLQLHALEIGGELEGAARPKPQAVRAEIIAEIEKVLRKSADELSGGILRRP